MQCTSYFPGCYSHRDLNGIPNGGPWPVYTNDAAPNMSGQSYNNLYPSPNVDQIRVVYQNEVLRQTMLRHENVFQEQVQELHRLHSRQRELMDEFKRRGLKESNIVPMSHYNFMLSKVSSNYTSMMWQTPTAPTLPWKLSTLGSKTPLPTFSFLDTSSKTENGFENNEVLPPKCKNSKWKMLDLELPADEYVDYDEEKGNEVHTNNSHCSSDRNVNMMAFDLNMPPTLSLESEIFQTNVEFKDVVKPDNGDNLNKECVKYRDEGILETKSKLYEFDLNSCVDEDEFSPTLPISKTIEPVSPENKESSPPRGDSEENHVETPVQMSKQQEGLSQEDSDSNDDLVSTAAKTIFLISKLSFNEKTKASLVESLDWFAGVVVSSMAYDLEACEVCLSSDGSEKEKTKCVVALPSQQGKRHRKRRMNRKIFETEVFRSVSSLTSYDLGFRENGLKCWGKVNKRRRGPRVATSSIRLLWDEK